MIPRPHFTPVAAKEMRAPIMYGRYDNLNSRYFIALKIKYSKSADPIILSFYDSNDRGWKILIDEVHQTHVTLNSLNISDKDGILIEEGWRGGPKASPRLQEIYIKLAEGGSIPLADKKGSIHLWRQ